MRSTRYLGKLWAALLAIPTCQAVAGYWSQARRFWCSLFPRRRHQTSTSSRLKSVRGREEDALLRSELRTVVLERRLGVVADQVELLGGGQGGPSCSAAPCSGGLQLYATWNRLCVVPIANHACARVARALGLALRLDAAMAAGLPRRRLAHWPRSLAKRRPSGKGREATVCPRKDWATTSCQTRRICCAK